MMMRPAGPTRGRYSNGIARICGKVKAGTSSLDAIQAVLGKHAA